MRAQIAASQASFMDKLKLSASEQALWRSKDNDDKKPAEGDQESNVPSGFEKLLKRTRRGITHEKKSESDKEAKESEKGKQEKKQEEEEELSEQEEDVGHKKKDKKATESEWSAENVKKKVTNFFMVPGGGGPRWENILMVTLLGGLSAYYLS